MKIVIDADGCPVVHLSLKIAEQFHVPCVIVCDTAHVFDVSAKVITVSKGADSADFQIANLITPQDIVVTQDYGLAAMCLARNAQVINQNGLIFTQQNIDGLLFCRHIHKKQRMAGSHLKGPKKREAIQDKAFETALIRLIQKTETK